MSDSLKSMGDRLSLLIRARGPDAAGFDPQTTRDSDSYWPDIVARFAGAASRGLFGGPGYPPWRSAAEVVDSQFDPALVERSWRLDVSGVDPGAFRVLRNMLAARRLDAFEIVEVVAGEARPLAIQETYPRVWPPRFEAVHEIPAREKRNRSVHVRLVAEPSDEVLVGIYADLESWTDLLLLGGYATDRIPPERATASPDQAFLFDPTTVVQTFDEVYLSAEEAFHAIINWASWLDAAGTLVREVHIY